ncbi:MAG: helix-turn-helix domain-containing protein [Chloroflexi bacterium]|nr:helix-turn-helix domain-containing protein [Chloroflexota bacterium]
MTTRAQQRATGLNQVLAPHWSPSAAAEALGMSERQLRRLVAEYEREGPKALSHGNRGRPPAHPLSAEVRARVVALARDQYAAANLVLVELLPHCNARFAVPAAQPGSAYRPPPAGFVPEQVFCFKYTRTVTPDNTIDFAKQTRQLLLDAQRASC